MLPLRPSTPAEKQEALDQVLASATFARSGQHRHFPQYVCELRFGIRGLPPVVGVEPCKPLIITGFGTTEWIRTTDLLLRRQRVDAKGQTVLRPGTWEEECGEALWRGPEACQHCSQHTVQHTARSQLSVYPRCK